MEIILDILTCIFEIVIFDVFFRNVTQKKYKNPLYNMLIFLAMLIIICSINSYGNSLLNLIGNIIIYFLSCCLLFETTLKKRIFYFIVFYTAFAGVEIIFANYAQTECQFRYCGTAIPFLTVRSTAR